MSPINLLSVGVFLILHIIYCCAANKIVFDRGTFFILLIILSALPLSLRSPRRPAYLSICQPPRPETYPSQVGSPVGSFLLVPSWSVQLSSSAVASSFLTGYYGPSFSGHSFSHQFCSSLTAFFAALSFSLLSRLDRLFYRPALVARYAVRKPSHRGLVAFSACAGWVTASVVRFSFPRRAAFWPPSTRPARVPWPFPLPP